MKNNKAQHPAKIVVFLLATSILCISPLALRAQDAQTQTSSIKKNGISVGLLGTTIPAGLVFDEFITDRFEAQVILGVFNPGLGLKYHFSTPQKKKWTLSAGAAVSYAWEADKMMYQMPISLNYYGFKNFQYTLNVVPTYSDYIDPQPAILPGIQIAYRMGGQLIDTNRIEALNRKSILSISIGATSATLGFNYERIVHPNLGLELGVGLISAGTGFKIYLPANRYRKLNFHTGASHYFASFLIAGGWKTYFPFGLSYVNPESRLRILLDAGPAIAWEKNIGSEQYPEFGVNLRIGWVKK